MKVLLLAGLESSHTYKWAIALARRGVNVCVVGMGSAYDPQLYAGQSNLIVRSLGVGASTMAKAAGNVSKVSYLMKLPQVKREIRLFKPDIVHAHFASSYGLLGSLSNFHPFIVSAWGSDVFGFPEISSLHRALLRFNLWGADRILSTSEIMAKQTNKFTCKAVEVTPFGVDIHQFSPIARVVRPGIVIGTVKNLEPEYGVEYLLQAFRVLSDRNPRLQLNLLVVGGGSRREQLENLAARLRIQESVTFTGHVPYREIARCHNMTDISVFTSISESFGVAAVEASACGNPVVASDVGGLPEIVEHGVTGFIVPPRDPHRIADAIEKLALDGPLRASMGLAGRERVKKLFNWDDNVSQMLEIYHSTLRLPQRASPTLSRPAN